MSQHFLNTQMEGKKIVVLLGWDNPLSGYFMVITKTLENTDENGRMYIDEEDIYSTLEDTKLKDGLSDELDYLKKKLTQMEISLPEDIFHVLINDQKLNAGNDVYYYDVVNYNSQPLLVQLP